MAAVAAVVTATAPLFVLIAVSQRQLVSGLTAGAVKVKGMKGSRPEQAVLTATRI